MNIGFVWQKHKTAVVIEGGLILLSAVAGLVCALAGANAYVSIGVGLLCIWIAQLVLLRYELRSMGSARGLPHGLRPLFEAHVNAEKKLGPDHVCMVWVAPRIDAVTAKLHEIGSNMRFRVRTGDSIDLRVLYERAFASDNRERAVCPQDGVSYFCLESGRESLRATHEAQRRGLVGDVTRLFVVPDALVDDPLLNGLIVLHHKLGWSVGQISPALFDTVKRRVIGELGTVADANSFKLFGSSCVCEAENIVEGRMQVAFAWDESVIGAYSQLFDEAIVRATMLTSDVDRSSQGAFDALYNQHVRPPDKH